MRKGFTVFLNSLPEIYDYYKKLGREEEGRNKIRSFLMDTFNDDLDEKVSRFLEIPGGAKPADLEYFKLYWELMQLYINGLYYSTVVLSGVISERICYDILSKQELILKSKGKLSEDQMRCLFELNLRDIIELLLEWGLIKKETRTEMHKINDKRNEYVHPKKTSVVNTKKDSKEMVERISRIIENEFEVKTFKGAYVKSL